jgi:hypothetical protein
MHCSLFLFIFVQWSLDIKVHNKDYDRKAKASNSHKIIFNVFLNTLILYGNYQPIQT